MDDELTFKERKLIDDILSHLDGWRVNDHPKESRKVKNFLDPDEARPSNQVRKEVSSREVLNAYEQAKIHALNYIRRNQFPKSPAVYLAICYWSAGLLSERVHFREEKVQSSYNLIEEARKLLAPHVRRGDDAFTVSGDAFFWDEYFKTDCIPHPRRDRRPECDERVDEPKELLTHGIFHKQPHPPKPKTCKPVHKCKLDWHKPKNKSKYKIKTDYEYSMNNSSIKFKSKIFKNGLLHGDGVLKYYIYE